MLPVAEREAGEVRTAAVDATVPTDELVVVVAVVLMPRRDAKLAAIEASATESEWMALDKLAANEPVAVEATFSRLESSAAAEA